MTYHQLLSLVLFAAAVALVSIHAHAEPTPSPVATSSGGCGPRSARLPNGTVVFRDCEGAPEMIPLKGGQFRMGDLVGDGQPYEKPAHDVGLKSFALGRYEVTIAEWGACVAAGACQPAKGPNLDELHGRYPVAGVSWDQAQAYVQWLSARIGKAYRLPSEAEWEYAERAGETGRYAWGTLELDVCSHANLADVSGRKDHPQWAWSAECDDHYAGAAPVGSFPANAWSFHDMVGNVWEWVADCWHSDFSGAPTDGSAWTGENCRKHVNRGGGWGNNVRALRLSSRDADPTGATSDALGFRVARSLAPAEVPAVPGAAPDTRPPPVEILVKVKKPNKVIVQQEQAAAQAQAAPSTPPPVASLATERTIEFKITLKGEQHWAMGPHTTHGTTEQSYVVSTRVRSDGVLYGDNLLDPDVNIRLAVKHQYLARRGLIKLKALNGGRLPANADEVATLLSKAKTNLACSGDDDDCREEATERVAALEALQSNSVADLEALIVAPAYGDAARWIYFFGYRGCPISIHTTNEMHAAGERAWDKKKTKYVPWSEDRSANATGTEEDKVKLCRRYTLTVDIRTGDIYLENLFIPSSPGSTIWKMHDKVVTRNDVLPVPVELLNWSSATLARGPDTVHLTTTLAPHAPLDGDYTVLGHFDGKLEVALDWAFRPVDGAPLAVIPTVTPP
ncbi:MAG: formylglycine-generating enzyme family protein [Nevskia sp.]|nr:formylglycine-generating enzyme family protein [Nevskia sp.]